jgi:hypothetical protein
MKLSRFDSIDEVAALTGGEVVYSESTGYAQRDRAPNYRPNQIIARKGYVIPKQEAQNSQNR